MLFMQLDKNKFALALSGTMLVAYAICTAFTALWPDVALKFLGWMLHLVNVERFAGGVELTFGGFVAGLLPILFYSYLVGWLFVWMYNGLLKPKAQ